MLPGFAAKYKKDASDVTKELGRHFLKCKIKVHAEGTGQGTGTRAIVEVGFHSLRHSFVSLCRQPNAPRAVVEAIVGHSNPAMTRHYTHVGELAAGQAVAALPAFGSGAAVPSAAPVTTGGGALKDQIIAICGRATVKTWRKDMERIAELAQGM